jgi:transcription antitermination factor NusA-like protein
MTSFTTKTMHHIQRRKSDSELLDYTQAPQVADRYVHAKHVVVTRSKFAAAISTQGRNVRLVIWLAGWHIAIYDEFVERRRSAKMLHRKWFHSPGNARTAQPCR